jgi:hypothetical protein
MMILPRQARDKHRENSKKACFVAAAHRNGSLSYAGAGNGSRSSCAALSATNNSRDCFPTAGPSLSWSNQQAFVATPLLLGWVEMFRELN